MSWLYAIGIMLAGYSATALAVGGLTLVFDGADRFFARLKSGPAVPALVPAPIHTCCDSCTVRVPNSSGAGPDAATATARAMAAAEVEHFLSTGCRGSVRELAEAERPAAAVAEERISIPTPTRPAPTVLMTMEEVQDKLGGLAKCGLSFVEAENMLRRLCAVRLDAENRPMMYPGDLPARPAPTSAPGPGTLVSL